MTQPLTVGFIGLGRMGSRMAANIAESGLPLVVYNRTTWVAEEFADAKKVERADSPQALTDQVDVVITMLADGEAVDAVYHGPEGVVKALTADKICVEMSTIGPTVVTELAASVSATGADLVDAPVSGSTAAVEGRTLMIMAGGDAAVVGRARPSLEAISTPVIHVGESGAGATLKLAINSIIYGINQSVAESLVMCERAGVDREVAYDAFTKSAAAAPVVKYRQQVFERPGEMPVSFTIDLAIKDLDLITALGDLVGAEVPQATVNREVMRQAAANGMGGRDMGDVAVYLRAEAG